VPRGQEGCGRPTILDAGSSFLDGMHGESRWKGEQMWMEGACEPLGIYSAPHPDSCLALYQVTPIGAIDQPPLNRSECVCAEGCAAEGCAAVFRPGSGVAGLPTVANPQSVALERGATPPSRRPLRLLAASTLPPSPWGVVRFVSSSQNACCCGRRMRPPPVVGAGATDTCDESYCGRACDTSRLRWALACA